MQLKLGIILSLFLIQIKTFQKSSQPKTPKKLHLQENLKKSMTHNFSWYFYRSDHLISENSEFRDTRNFDGFNIFHFHKNSSGFFRTYSKCPKKISETSSIHPVHIRISNFIKKIFSPKKYKNLKKRQTLMHGLRKRVFSPSHWLQKNLSRFLSP